jgi:hypothetical protein
VCQAKPKSTKAPAFRHSWRLSLDTVGAEAEYPAVLRRDSRIELDLVFSDLLLREITGMEDKLSKAKGKKEKQKLKDQAKEKKQLAAKQRISKTSKSETTLGVSRKSS